MKKTNQKNKLNDSLELKMRPFFLFFIDNLNPKKKFVIFFLLVFTLSVGFFLINLAISYYDNTLFLDGNNEGFLEDYVNWSHLTAVGLSLLTFRRFYLKMSPFFRRLCPVIDWNILEKKDFNDIKDRSEKQLQGLGSYIFLLIFFIISGLILSYQITFISQADRSYDIWHSLQHQPGLYIYAIYNFITLGFIIPVIVFQYLMAVLLLLKVPTQLKNDENYALRIMPLASDKAGGLGVFGEISLSLYYSALVPLILVISGLHRQLFYTDTPELSFLYYLPFYFVSIIIVFLFPLRSIHKLMTYIRNMYLEKISIEYNQILKSINNVGKKVIKDKQLAKLTHLKFCYEEYDKIPHWPLDIQTIKRFAGSFTGSVLIPVMIFLVQELSIFK